MYKLVTFSVGPYDNNVYLLSDPKSKEALLIDAANDAPRIIKELEGLRVSHILTTHGHGDHVQALFASKPMPGSRATRRTSR